MVINPCFRLEAKGTDVTEHIKKNLMSLSLDDRDGLDSDELTLSISGVYERPLLGDTLRVALGANGEYCDYGFFKVQNTAIDYKDSVTQVKATAVDFSGNLKERRSKLWEALTIADIATQIATDNELTVSAKGAETVLITSEAQNNESDINFLMKIANKYGYICMIKDNTIVIKKFGDEESSSGKISIDIKECSELTIERAAKNVYKSVKISWQDLDTATTLYQIAGSGNPVYSIDNIRPKSPAEALQIAEAKLKFLNSGGVMGSLSITKNIFIRAGYTLNLSGIGADSGACHIEGVTHNLSASEYSINIEFKVLGG